MLHSPAQYAALQAETGVGCDLQASVEQVEHHLAALTDAMRAREAGAVELQAEALHRALARAVEAFMHTARHGGVPTPLRLRLARASAQVARQRETLARATAALDRAIDVLMPAPSVQTTQVYSAEGRLAAPPGGRSLSA